MAFDAFCHAGIVAKRVDSASGVSFFAEICAFARLGPYWMPGSRFYGRTKQGEYMPEEQARVKGYSPANGTGR